MAAWHEQAYADAILQWRAHSPRHTRDLAGVRASLDALKHRTVGELDWALRTTLDMFDWRLDAWITSQATRRLADLRAGTDEDNQPVAVLHLTTGKRSPLRSGNPLGASVVLVCALACQPAPDPVFENQECWNGSNSKLDVYTLCR